MSFSVRRLREERPKRALPWKPLAIALLSISGALASIYGRERGRVEDHRTSVRRTTLLKKTLLVLIAVLCAFLLLAGTVKALMSLRIISLQTVTKLTGTPPATDANGYTNILLLGQGNADHDGVNLTDTIIVASLDPSQTKSAVMLSLPRDLYFLATEKMGKGKLNSMYRDYRSFLRYEQGMEDETATQEAMQELAREIGRAIGLEIHGVVKVNFAGFVQAVDAIEGIDVVVPEAITDTEYPDENFGYETFSIAAGPQHLDGETALKYARSRHSTSDFDRSARQQQIIAAIAEKARSLGLERDPKRIIELLHILAENVETTLNLGNIIGLADIAQNIDRSRIVAMQLNDRNALYDGAIEPGGFLYTPPRDLFGGASVLLPVSIPEYPVTWKQIHTFSDLLFRHREVYLAGPQFAVLNAGAPPGSAGKLATELIRYGFSVGPVANAPGEKRPTSLIAPTVEEARPLADFFATLLTVPLDAAPADLTEETRAPLTIILGTDYRYSPIQNLVPNAQ